MKKSQDSKADHGDYNAHDRAMVAKRSTWVSVLINSCLVIVQILVGIFSHSQALISDGIHSLTDLISDGVVLVANKYSHLEADDNHPYGHLRFETAASFILGLLLLVVGIGMLASAVIKLNEPHLIAKVSIYALVIAIIALLSKELLFRYMLRIAKRLDSNMLLANAWHARSDAASSFIVSLGILGNLMGYSILDPIAAALVGFMVCKMGWVFGWRAFSDLMDSSATKEEIDAIEQTLRQTPSVLGVHELRTRKMGDMLVADAHIEVNAHLTVIEAHEIAVDARNRVLTHHKVLSFMAHIDPSDFPDDDHLPHPYFAEKTVNNTPPLPSINHNK